MFNRDLDSDEKSVRGSLVTGLSEEDVRLLDIFEGNVSATSRLRCPHKETPSSQQYTRQAVSVYPLGPLINIRDMPPIEAKSLVPTTPPLMPTLDSLTSPIEADTYVWCLPPSELWTKLWTFEEFVKFNAWKWIGSGSANNKDYDEVDRRRAMDGIIVPAETCNNSVD